MKRQLKFRAWCTKNHRMVDQQYLEAHKYGLRLFRSAPDEDGHDWSDGFEIMQFTGLKDKNGVEIYESDIVSYWETDRSEHKSIYKVKFNTGRFLLVRNFLDVKTMFICGKHDQCEVIGNIYENPELLAK